MISLLTAFIRPSNWPAFGLIGVLAYGGGWFMGKDYESAKCEAEELRAKIAKLELDAKVMGDQITHNKLANEELEKALAEAELLNQEYEQALNDEKSPGDGYESKGNGSGILNDNDVKRLRGIYEGRRQD